MGYESIRLYTPYGAARARAFYEREGWEQEGRRVSGAAPGARPGRVPATGVIPEGMFEDVASGRACRWRRAGSGVRARLADDDPGRDRGRGLVGDRQVVVGHPAPFFAPVAAIIALGQTRRARPARGGARGRGDDRRRDRRPARLPVRRRACRSSRLAVFLAVGLGMFFGTSQLFVNQVAISAALVFTITPPTGGVSFARTLDALTGGMVALGSRRWCSRRSDPDPARCGAAGPGRARRDAAGDRGRVAPARRRGGGGGAGPRARHRRVRRALLRRHARGPLDDAPLAAAGARGTRSSSTPRPRPGSTSRCATCACSPAARCARWRWTRTSRPRWPTPWRTSPARSARSRRAGDRRGLRRRARPRVARGGDGDGVLEGTTNLSGP